MLDIGRAVENAQWLLLLQKQQYLVLERTGFGIFYRNDMSKMQTFWRLQHPLPYELELLPIYLALYAWGGMLKSTHLVCYLDNDAARAALCKGYGSNELAQRIVGCTMQLESRFKTKSWFARVPSHSNISDGPSRLDCREVEQLGSKRIEIDWEIILENLFGVSGASSKRGEHGHTE